MAGETDYMAVNGLNYIGLRAPMPTLTALYLGLFTTAPTSNSGVTGAVEVSGGAYARVQIAGQLTAGASWTTSSTAITLAAAAPAWLTAIGVPANAPANPGAGVNVYDLTTGQQIGTVQSVSGSTVTLQAAASHASSGASDNLLFSVFAAPANSSGSEPGVTPAQMQNGAQVNFTQATASWGTVQAWGIFDASTGGNLLAWDWMGADSYGACTITAASPGVITSHAHGLANGDNFIYTAKDAGAVPSFSQSNLTGLLTAANVTTDTLTATNGATAVNTSSSGDGAIRKVVPQPVAINVQLYLAATAITLTRG